MHFRAQHRPPVLVSHQDTAVVDQAWTLASVSPRKGGGGPPGGPPGGGGSPRIGASPARLVLLAVAALLLACGAVISKHRSQLVMRQCYEAKIAALDLEKQQQQARAAEAAAAAGRMGATCSAQAAALRAELSAGAEAERAALAEAVAANTARDAAEALAAKEQRRRESLEDATRRLGLMQHVPVTVDAALEGRSGLAAELGQLDHGGTVLLTVCDRSDTHPEDFLTAWAVQVQRSGVSDALMMTTDRVLPGKARSLGLRALRLDPTAVPAGPRAARPAIAKWAAIKAILSLGHSVLYAAPTVALLRDPLPAFKQDADIEAAAEAAPPVFRNSDGPVVVVPSLSPDLLFLRPTPAALELADEMLKGLAAATSGRSPTNRGTPGAAATVAGDPAESRLFTAAALLPALTAGTAGAPVRLRILPPTGPVVAAPDLLAAEGRAKLLKDRAAVAVLTGGRSSGGGSAALALMRALGENAEGRAEKLEGLPQGHAPAGGRPGLLGPVAAGGAAVEVRGHSRPWMHWG